jgi:hypothetical protein
MLARTSSLTLPTLTELVAACSSDTRYRSDLPDGSAITHFAVSLSSRKTGGMLTPPPPAATIIPP